MAADVELNAPTDTVEFYYPSTAVVPGTQSVQVVLGGVTHLQGPPIPFSDALPAPLGTPSAGVSEEVSRADHVHEMPAALDVGIETLIAGEALGGHRVVYSGLDGKAFYATNTVPSHAHLVLGVTTGAAALGEEVSVRTIGIMAEGSWSWALEQPIFLGENGLLTQTPPVAPAFSRIIAFPLTATSIYISLREPIQLN